MIIVVQTLRPTSDVSDGGDRTKKNSSESGMMVAAIRRALRKIHSLSGLVSLIRPSLDMDMLAG